MLRIRAKSLSSLLHFQPNWLLVIWFVIQSILIVQIFIVHYVLSTSLEGKEQDSICWAFILVGRNGQ